MNGTDLALRDENAAVLEDLITKGDLDKLTAEARAKYYVLTCESLGLNPLTKPFEYLRLQGNRLTLYATRTATDQLRAKHGVSIRIVDRRREDDLYVVTAQATLPDGRQDEATGAVTISGQRGEALANALMKAETKAKRRVTLSVCGLGWMDETETATVPGAQRVDVDASTGEIEAPPKAAVRGMADKRKLPAADTINETPENVLAGLRTRYEMGRSRLRTIGGGEVKDLPADAGIEKATHWVEAVEKAVAKRLIETEATEPAA